MFINDSDLKRVMTEYCKRLMTDRKSVAYYELLGAIEVLKHAGLIGNEDYVQLINFDRMLAAARGNWGAFPVTDAEKEYIKNDVLAVEEVLEMMDADKECE